MLNVSVVNYGVGNLRNVKRGLEKAGVEVTITNNPKTIANTDAIVLPGVGAFAEAMKNVTPLLTELNDVVKSGRPVLGICLGLQLLFTKSHERGLFSGLNHLKGEVIKLPINVKLPHMGWNTIEIINSNKFTENIPEESWMYFVHTYVPQPLNSNIIIAQTEYGIKFPSVIAEKNMFATQFHPEKSGKVGLQMLKNFTKIIKR
jgi:glutamine amidotransferase